MNQRHWIYSLKSIFVSAGTLAWRYEINVRCNKMFQVTLLYVLFLAKVDLIAIL